jgi:aspartate beta-hydroxylase
LEPGNGEYHEPSEEHIEGLTAKPLWDKTEFPWAHTLEEKSHIIQEEFEAKIKRDSNLFAGDSSLQNSVMGGGWSAIRLQRLGVWNLVNCKEFPKTYQLLKELNIPLAVRGVCFARQAPGSGVKPHSDGRNFILTSHLGIKIPDGCWIEVAKKRRSWEEQHLLTLDTSFVHSTGNPTAGDRYVLIIDFWHPELTEAERAGLEFIYDLRNKFETGLIPVRKPTKKVTKKNAPVGTGIGGWFDSILRGEQITA